jgi:sulfur carrier protein
MKFNGKDFSLTAQTKLTDFLEEQGYKITHIAVELNGEIPPKSKYDKIILKDTDALEVVTFMGGGCC